MRKHAFFLLVLLSCFTINASIIKKPPAKQAELTYKELPCTEQDRAYIYEIISTVGETNKLSLYFKQSRLKEMGSYITHVHPLKFLSVAFTNPHLKSCMFFIWNDYFKRTEFMDGLGPSLTREADKGKLLPYLQEFSTEVNVPAENVRYYLESREWENMVLYLIQS